MILKKIKQLHKEFGHLNNDDCSDLGFTPRIENLNTLKFQLRRGKWSALHFSILEELNLSLGFKIIPFINGSKWPSYILYAGGGGAFYACDSVSTMLFHHLSRLYADRELCKTYAKEWETINKIVLPVYKLFGGQDELAGITSIVFDKKKWPAKDISDKEVAEKYRAFCINRDNSAGAQFLWTLLDELQKSKKTIPTVPDIDLGIYATRIKKLIALRAWKLGISEVTENNLTLTFEGFKEQHGYDTAELYPDYYPCKGTDEVDNNYMIAEVFFRTRNARKVSQTVKSQPEFIALKGLVKSGRNGFTGKEFLEAASILDEEYNEPKRAWNCLVSAGYWAGKNLPEGQDTIVKAAIYLCEKHNWLEASEVLKHNLDILQSA